MQRFHMTSGSNAHSSDPKDLSRREFLYYISGASIALFGAATCAAVSWFAREPTPDAEQTQVCEHLIHSLPTSSESPIVGEGEYFLVNIDQQLLALYDRCPFRNFGVKVKWVSSNNRYECPHCGSHFRLDGLCIDGPSPRGLDRYLIRVETKQGSFATPLTGDPVSIEGADSIFVDTCHLIVGPSVW